MKKYKMAIDIVLLVGLGVVSALAIAPKEILMPSSVQMALLAALLALLVAFMAVVWRENPADEREFQNQSTASRAAYLVGVFLLIVALVYQSIKHEVDPYVPITLFGMIATKVIAQRSKDG
jgi:disulfide bond formation protein DsbB